MFSFGKLKELFDKYEGVLSASTLIFGFLLDFFTLQRVDYWLDNIFIVSYLAIAGASIFLINLYEAGGLRNKFITALYEFVPFTMQFAFGGLFSAFTIFYSKSSSWVSSAIFVALLFGLMVGNEFFKHRYSKLSFQMGIYFLALFSFSIYILPVLIRQMGPRVFLYSGALSLGFIGFFIFLISKLAPLRYKESYRPLLATMAGIWAVMNIFYFTNIIPPIPLSLKYGNVYHSVTRKEGGGYLAQGEKEKGWFSKFYFSKDLRLASGEEVYVFSSVFSPSELNTKIVHNWQYFSSKDNKWISLSRITFPIIGGRNEGYRGFSKKSNIFPGKWRVDVETERGQVIGRIRFDIQESEVMPELEKLEL